MVVQFLRFVGNAVQGDFGRSLRQGRSVAVLIKERLPATLELSLGAALLALLVGIPRASTPPCSAAVSARSCC